MLLFSGDIKPSAQIVASNEILIDMSSEIEIEPFISTFINFSDT